MIRFLAVKLSVLALAFAAPAGLAMAQSGSVTEQVEVAPPPQASQFDTSYQASAVVSLRVQRRFLDDVRWAAGVDMRKRLEATFAERRPVEIWQEIVGKDGFATGNVADALAAYWILNWITANAAYGVKVDGAAVQAQVRAAMANDPNFRSIGDQKRQETAEEYILNFLIEHAALNDALAREDTGALTLLATEAVSRFRRKLNIDLLSLVPGPNGFEAGSLTGAKPTSR